MVVSYRRFGTDILYRKVRKELPFCAAKSQNSADLKTRSCYYWTNRCNISLFVSYTAEYSYLGHSQAVRWTENSLQNNGVGCVYDDIITVTPEICRVEFL
jgi:hypothetical protein